MPTRHFSNFNFSLDSPWANVMRYAYFVLTLCLMMSTEQIQSALLVAGISTALYWSVQHLIQRAIVTFTFTSSHFQLHSYKGGAILKWNNIRSMETCVIEIDNVPLELPWVGIKIRDYQPFLDSICPRLISGILLEQRGLLYTGIRLTSSTLSLEDALLDDTPYTCRSGKVYKGLLAMLANRMHYYQSTLGYDFFIANQDIGMEAEDFVGMARRYLAAAEPD